MPISHGRYYHRWDEGNEIYLSGGYTIPIYGHANQNVERLDDDMDEQNVRGNPYFTKEQRGQYPYLTRDIQCDVLVVGGGATGAIVAHYFAKNNIDTVVIEKSRVGHGSTSITTALLQYELDDRAVDLLPILGEQAIRCSYQLGQFALQQLEDFIGRTGNRCQYGKVDSLLYTAKEGEVGQIETEYQYRKEWGFSVELVNPKCHPYGLSLTAGLLAKGGGAVVNPYQFTHQLLEEACKEGARVYENSAAVKVNHQQDGVVVETVFGHKITCKKVICATGYNTSLFTQRNFANQYATFNLVTQPIPHLNPALKGVVIRDNSDPYHYLRTTADGRVMVGGEDVPFQPDFQQEGVRQKRLKDRLFGK